MVKTDIQTFVDDILTSEFMPDSVNGTNLHNILRKIYLGWYDNTISICGLLIDNPDGKHRVKER